MPPHDHPSEPLRIVHTVASLRADHGGTSRSVPALCSALAELGCEVSIVAQQSPPGIASIAPRHPGVAVTLVPLRPRWAGLLGGHPLFRQAVRQRLSGNAVLHDHGVWLPTNRAVARLAGPGRPLVSSPRGMLSGWALSQRRGIKRLAWSLYQRRSLERASALHATSAEEAADLARLALAVPIAVVPNGTELPPEPPRPPAEAAASSPPTVLFLSRVHPKKGVIELVQAWAQVRPSGWRLVLAGPGEIGHRRSVRAELDRLGLDEVELRGPVDDEDKWQLYRAADLFVLPSHSENFGLVVAEALASAVPVITTRGTPWAEVVERGCGWCIEMSVDALQSVLREATALGREGLASMGERGRRWVESRYAWRSVARDMLRLYVWTAGLGPRPDDLLHTSSPDSNAR
jgi:glycosyltransferase involved in cell wall biosynthesis